MPSIRRILKATGRRISFDLPEDFPSDLVEIIVAPYAGEDDNARERDDTTDWQEDFLSISEWKDDTPKITSWNIETF